MGRPKKVLVVRAACKRNLLSSRLVVAFLNLMLGQFLVLVTHLPFSRPLQVTIIISLAPLSCHINTGEYGLACFHHRAVSCSHTHYVCFYTYITASFMGFTQEQPNFED